MHCSLRATNLARLLARHVDGILLSDFEQGEIGSDLFRHACLMDLETKNRDRPYRAGRSPHWVKVKNRKHPRCCASWTRSPDVSSRRLRPEILTSEAALCQYYRK